MESLFGLQEEVQKEDISIALIIREQFFTSALFQGHSGRNPIDPSLQDTVLITDIFFEYIYHFGCAKSVYTPSEIQD